MLQGNGKVFGAIGIALAMYSTTPKANRKKLCVISTATLTAVVVGITEPLEFTFLFIAPYLFVIHALLARQWIQLCMVSVLLVTWAVDYLISSRRTGFR